LEPGRQIGTGPTGLPVAGAIRLNFSNRPVLTGFFAVFFNQFCDIKKGLFCPVLSIFMALMTNRYESKGEGEGEGEGG
jgi:hypothetical protein